MNFTPKSHIIITATTIIIIISIFSSSTKASSSIFQDNEAGHKIITIKTSTYNQTLQAFPRLVILFYTEKCPICRAFQPKYTRLNKLLNETQSSTRAINQVQLAKININQERTLGILNNVKGIPTIIFYYNGQPYSKYGKRNKGPNVAEFLFDWLIKLNDHIIRDEALVQKYKEAEDEFRGYKMYLVVLTIVMSFAIVVLVVYACCYRHGRCGYKRSTYIHFM